MTTDTPAPSAAAPPVAPSRGSMNTTHRSVGTPDNAKPGPEPTVGATLGDDGEAPVHEVHEVAEVVQPRSFSSPTMAAYRAGCEAYAEAVTAAHRSRTEAEERYRMEVAAVRETARREVARREAAVRYAQEARDLVAETDDAAADIWRRLAVYSDRRKLGLTPPPREDAEPHTPSEIRKLLAQAKRNIGLAQRGELPFPPPAHALPIAAAIGALSGLLSVWGAGLLLSAAAVRTDGAAAAFQALALVALFVGVFAGVPTVSGWLAVRHRLAIRPVHVAAAITGAVAGICALSPLALF
ncbi:hypothetical protein FB566_1310 [Stackebrandtia endophytica]|uniref:Uncharacterized protein n=2 Tax=Stackebrandtia endophytica TaxID=1496996 RepID=A0A543ATF4_9ACTN|nr:hypothetical protein FB566_1310 [Stackebrandtia endophytica]